MKKFNNCFIKDGDTYLEVPYSTLIMNGKRNPEYNERFFLPFNEYLMEVSKQDYLDFYKNIRRQKYLREESQLHNEVSYHALDSDKLYGEEILKDVFVNVEAEAIQSIMLIKLRKALLQLSKMELQLIDALYFQSKSERTYSVETGIPRMTISNRKNRIIEKLKKLLEK